MSVVLSAFLSYHLKMASNNQTTNENYKVEDCHFALDKEFKVLESLLKKTEEWSPEPDSNSKEMPKITVDGKAMPSQKKDRIQKFKDMIKDCNLRKQRLTDKSPYRPKESVCAAIRDIWNQK